MPEWAKTFLKSKTFKLLVGAIAAALATYAGTGCAGLLAGSHAKSLDVLACKIDVLEPYLGEMAAEAVREFDGNQAFSPGAFLSRQGLTAAELTKVARAYLACSGEDPDAAPAPAPEPTLQPM